MMSGLRHQYAPRWDWPWLAASLLLIGVGLFSWFFGRGFLSERGATRSKWPTVVGEVVSSELDRYVHSSDDSKDWNLTVQFVYVMDGVRYLGNQRHPWWA